MEVVKQIEPAITDHFGILRTSERERKLKEPEQRVLFSLRHKADACYVISIAWYLVHN